jgi:AcrR family transcriptional regulator
VRVRRRPQQQRSKAAYERVIEHARHLAHERDFDAISIQELARGAGCSIGSFYYRFGTKDEFFRVLVDDMIARRDKAVQETFRAYAVADLPAELAREAVANHRAYAGLLRSIIKKHLEGEPAWKPISLLGRRITTEYTRRVAEARGAPLSAAQIERISFSFVWLYGLLAQGLLGLNTIFGLEMSFFEEEAIASFQQAISHALEATDN